MSYRRRQRNQQQQYAGHVQQDKVEEVVLQMQPRLKLLDEMQKINEVAKDPNMTTQINAERKQIQEVISLITQKYGVSIFDVYGKLGAENVREQILHAREQGKARTVKGYDQDVLDLVNEDGVLLQRNAAYQKDIDAHVKQHGEGKPYTSPHIQEEYKDTHAAGQFYQKTGKHHEIGEDEEGKMQYHPMSFLIPQRRGDKTTEERVNLIEYHKTHIDQVRKNADEALRQRLHLERQVADHMRGVGDMKRFNDAKQQAKQEHKQSMEDKYQQQQQPKPDNYLHRVKGEIPAFVDLKEEEKKNEQIDPKSNYKNVRQQLLEQQPDYIRHLKDANIISRIDAKLLKRSKQGESLRLEEEKKVKDLWDFIKDQQQEKKVHTPLIKKSIKPIAQSKQPIEESKHSIVSGNVKDNFEPPFETIRGSVTAEEGKQKESPTPYIGEYMNTDILDLLNEYDKYLLEEKVDRKPIKLQDELINRGYLTRYRTGKLKKDQKKHLDALISGQKDGVAQTLNKDYRVNIE